MQHGFWDFMLDFGLIGAGLILGFFVLIVCIMFLVVMDIVFKEYDD